MGEAPKQGNILIVDDVPDNLTVLRKMLTSHGFRVQPAISGEIALKAVESDLPDLILLDIMMPQMDGYEVCRILKSNARTKDIPIIFISALNETDDVVRAFETGGVDYITKPFQTEEVLARVNTHIALQEAIREKEASRMMLATILGSIESTIVTVDRSLNIINSNRAISTICPKNDKTNFSHRLREGAAPCARALKETFATGQPRKEFRVTCTCDPLQKKTMVLTTALLNLGGDSCGGAVLAIRDITRLVHLEKQLIQRHSFHRIIGKNENMQAVYSLLEKMADLDVNVLICGDNGTGKELIADAFHFKGSRAGGPLVKVNCAALSESLLESELFGHVRGAFTGAVKDRTGRCQAAEGGTLFLDEIGDISLQFQAKLLRFLEYKEFERIGESRTRKADVRIIAATNQDLAQKVIEGQFRQDLFYRLKGVMIQLPPLAQRLDDIPLLTRHFLLSFSQSLNKHIVDVSRDVSKIFTAYAWPGNVRELKSVLYHASALCTGEEIQKEDLPGELLETNTATLTALYSEKDKVMAALESTDWNKAKAARLLGMSRATIYNKILKHDIRPGDKEAQQAGFSV